MRKHWILLLLVLGMIVGSASARNRRERRPERPPTRQDCLRQIDLSEEQEEAILAIRQAAIAAFREAETREDARAIIDQMHADIEDVLTDEQLAQLRECLRPKRPPTCWDELDLSIEQIAKMDEIRAAARAALREAETAEEAQSIIERMHQAIEAVLTNEQLAQLRECLRPKEPVNCMKQIDLTEDQIALMDEIRAAAMELLEAAESREEIRAIMDQMHDDLMSVLDDDQLAALQECRDEQRQHNRRR